MKLGKYQLGVSGIITLILIIISATIGAGITYYVLSSNNSTKTFEADQTNYSNNETGQNQEMVTSQDKNEKIAQLEQLNQELRSNQSAYESILQNNKLMNARIKQLEKQARILKKQLKDAKMKLRQIKSTKLTNIEKPKPAVPAQNQPGDNAKKLESMKKSKPKAVVFECPSIDTFNQNISKWRWKDNNINWWVTYTQRPIVSGEKIISQFKAVNVGDAVDCYYYYGKSNSKKSRLATLAIRTNSPKSTKIIGQGNSWQKCDSNACKFMCESENSSNCNFYFKK